MNEKRSVICNVMKKGTERPLRIGSAYDQEDGSTKIYLDAFPANGRLVVKAPDGPCGLVRLSAPSAQGWNVIEYGPSGPVALTEPQRTQVQNELNRAKKLQPTEKKARAWYTAAVLLDAAILTAPENKDEMMARAMAAMTDARALGEI